MARDSMFHVTNNNNDNDRMMSMMTTKEIKDLMKITIVFIGAITTIALVSWISYEVNTFRADLAEGVAWMGPFL